MTGVAFESWLKAWDKKLKRDGRKVLLYVGNCLSHPKLVLQNITLKFFPPNTTAMSQPMDQGIIQNLKVHYRRFLLRERIRAIDGKKEFRFNLLDALHLLRRAWDAMTAETVRNCFRKAAFVINDLTDDDVMPDDGVQELVTIWQDLRIHGEIDDEISMTDYIGIDEQVLTEGILSLDEIAEECSTTNADTSEFSDMEVMEIDAEEGEMDEPVITTLEAQCAMRIVRQYVQKNAKDPVVLRCSDKIYDFLFSDRCDKQKQTKVTDLFVAI